MYIYTYMHLFFFVESDTVSGLLGKEIDTTCTHWISELFFFFFKVAVFFFLLPYALNNKAIKYMYFKQKSIVLECFEVSRARQILTYIFLLNM